MTMESQQKTTPMKVRIQISKEKTTLGDLEDIPLSKIKLDPENVRFKHLPSEMTDKQIEAEWAKHPWEHRSKGRAMAPLALFPKCLTSLFTDPKSIARTLGLPIF